MTICCGGKGPSCGGALIPTPCDNEHVVVQRQMVADMHLRGRDLGGFTDPTTREALTLGQMFDRHAVCLAVCEEFGLLTEDAKP